MQISAMTGAAPVPVPPPKPAVINTMWLSFQSVPDHLFALEGCLAPDFGIGAGAQAFGELFPSWILTGALEISRAWASVLAAINLTPWSLRSDHVVDGVSAGPADTDDLDFCRFFIVNVSKHVSPPDVIVVDAGHLVRIV